MKPCIQGYAHSTRIAVCYIIITVYSSKIHTIKLKLHINRMILVIIKSLILFSLFPNSGNAWDNVMEESMILNPEQYIKITDWSFFVPFGKVAIIHHVTIENNSDITYKDIKVKVSYYSGSYSNYGTKVSSETGVLQITIPPRSKKTYLKDGAVLGSGSSLMYAGNIEVLDAVPLTGNVVTN
jgi:hypothetical protein